VDAATVRRWLELAAVAIGERRDELTALDAAIGDADHGANMERGFQAVRAKLADLAPDAPPGRVLTTAGATLVSTVGGASGPLWGSALRRAGRSLGEAGSFDRDELVAALEAALAAVIELGGAREGDKTMVDALVPAIRGMRDCLQDGWELAEAVDAAARGAEAGARLTAPMRAARGRASYLGERSIGHQDPGATSVALVIDALARAVREGA
jgi:phosphoenolpyruvate---glycerone phosphotransferase subunit DhaL